MRKHAGNNLYEIKQCIWGQVFICSPTSPDNRAFFGEKSTVYGSGSTDVTLTPSKDAELLGKSIYV